MGMMLFALALAAMPADGRSVTPLPGATPATELRCDGALANAYLTTAAKGLGVRAPAVPGTVHCTLITNGKSKAVTLDFTNPGVPVVVGADQAPVLGQDTEGVFTLRGRASRAAGSAGSAEIRSGEVHATLPHSKMPQNLVVLVTSPNGSPAYTVAPLLGRAKVSVKTRKNSKLEAVVAGRRTAGFSSDAQGKARISIPAPPGFVKAELKVTDARGRSSRTSVKLPAAKALYAVAALGPAGPVAPGSTVTVVVAGANPVGLPPKASELKAAHLSDGAHLVGVRAIAPGLWNVTLVAPAKGAFEVALLLGNAATTVSMSVKPEELGLAALTDEPLTAKPAPEKLPEAEDKAAQTQRDFAPPAEKPEARVAEAKPVERDAEKPEVAAPAAPRHASDDSTVHLGLLVEAGYLTNGGAISGLAPGASVQLSYRLDALDLGLSADLLVASASKSATTPFGGGSIDTSTTTQALQVLAGPWARYRFTEMVGVDLGVGVGMARVTQAINAGAQLNSSGVSTTVAYGGTAGLDLSFGIARVFGGVRYTVSSADAPLSGPAGGFAALLGAGVDLGL